MLPYEKRSSTLRVSEKLFLSDYTITGFLAEHTFIHLIIIKLLSRSDFWLYILYIVFG